MKKRILYSLVAIVSNIPLISFAATWELTGSWSWNPWLDALIKVFNPIWQLLLTWGIPIFVLIFTINAFKYLNLVFGSWWNNKIAQNSNVAESDEIFEEDPIEIEKEIEVSTPDKDDRYVWIKWKKLLKWMVKEYQIEELKDKERKRRDAYNELDNIEQFRLWTELTLNN